MIIGIASADFLRSDMNTSGIDQWGGSGWARIGQYIPAIKAAGHQVATGIFWQHDDCCAIEEAGGNMVFPDIIITQRLMHKGLANAYKLARNAGQIVVCDVDDWYWGLSPRNEAFAATHPKMNADENIINYKSSIAAASYVTVSTQYLWNRLNDWGSMNGITMMLHRNTVDVSRFKLVNITDTTVPEVGWAGSTSHRSGDLEIMRGILPSMVRAKHIKLVHGGHLDGTSTFAEMVGVEPEDVRTIERTGHEDYPKLLDFEVGIVPLVDTPFNLAKSDIKGLEYAAAGIPFVASGVGSYAEHKRRRGIYLAKKPYEWRKHLEYLRDPQARFDASQAVRAFAENRNIEYGNGMMTSMLDYVKPR